MCRRSPNPSKLWDPVMCSHRFQCGQAGWKIIKQLIKVRWRTPGRMSATSLISWFVVVQGVSFPLMQSKFFIPPFLSREVSGRSGRIEPPGIFWEQWRALAIKTHVNWKHNDVSKMKTVAWRVCPPVLSRTVIYNTQMRTCWQEQKRGVEWESGEFF